MKLSKHQSGQYLKKIGMYKNKGGKRVPRYFYFGHDESDAILAAAKLVRRWKQIRLTRVPLPGADSSRRALPRPRR